MKLRDSFYFSHDYNAKNSPKMLDLRLHLGWEGYGLYWAVVEMLNETPSHKILLSRIPAIALSLNTDSEKFKGFISTCVSLGIFTQSNEQFWCEEVIVRIRRRKRTSLARSKSGRVGGQIRAERIKATRVTNSETTSNEENSNVANAKQTSGKNVAKRSKGKERKGKEIKGKESKRERGGKRSLPSSLDEVLVLFLERGYPTEEASKFWNHYDANGWVQKSGQKIQQWKTAAAGWVSRSKDFQTVKNFNGKQQPTGAELIASALSRKANYDAIDARIAERDNPGGSAK